MKYALIGCGRISYNHISAALKNGLEVAAICDINSERMDEKIEKFHLGAGVKKYLNYKEMLENEKPELVAIATESGKHAMIALDCIESGSHIFIEKPIALSLADADNIINASDKKGVKVCACHQNRFNKSIQKIKEAIDKKRFGKLYYGTAHIRWSREKEYYLQAPWRGTWEQDGGALMNQCIHNIDLLRWLLGNDIVEVVGFTDRLKHDYIQAEDLGIAMVQFANGCYGIIEGTTNVYPQNLEETLYLFGEKGTVKAGGKSVNIIEEWTFTDSLDNSVEVKQLCNEQPPDVYGFGHSPLYKDMIDAIISNRKPYVDATDGKRALELVLAIYKSARDGGSVSLPLRAFSTVDMKEKIF